MSRPKWIWTVNASIKYQPLPLRGRETREQSLVRYTTNTVTPKPKINPCHPEEESKREQSPVRYATNWVTPQPIINPATQIKRNNGTVTSQIYYQLSYPTTKDQPLPPRGRETREQSLVMYTAEEPHNQISTLATQRKRNKGTVTSHVYCRGTPQSNINLCYPEEEKQGNSY